MISWMLLLRLKILACTTNSLTSTYLWGSSHTDRQNSCRGIGEYHTAQHSTAQQSNSLVGCLLAFCFASPAIQYLIFHFPSDLSFFLSFWFRWFILNFEKLLQETTGKCIYIPYWDWERDAEWERFSDLMHPATFGAWGATNGMGCATNGITNYHPPFLRSPGINNGPSGCVTRDFLNGFSFTGEAQILAMVSNYNQFADTTGNAFFLDPSRPAPTGTTNSFHVEFENGPHMLVHGIIAGHMGTNWSPADPLFWLHHSNVDRIWTMWQDYWDHDTMDVADYSQPWHFDSNWGLDQPLAYRPSERLSSWDFRMQYRDKEPAFPTVRDVMSNDSPLMSVRYQNSYLNTLMPNYEPNPRLFQTASDAVPVKCDRNAWEWNRNRNRNLNQEQKQEAETETEIEDNNTIVLTASSTKTNTDTETFRSSLRGNDAQEIEDNLESFFRAPNSGSSSTSASDSIEVVANEYCGRPPVFTLQEDRDEWDRLCRELPASTSMAERLALLAESDCNRKGNPRSDAPEIRERISMTMLRAFDAPSSAYECFHRPDRPPV